MKQALIYTSVASMIEQFNMDNINVLIDLGYKVDVACNFKDGSTVSNEKIKELEIELKKLNVDIYHIPIPRSITAIKEIYLSYKMTKDLLKLKKYDLIHCHSPIGGVISRIANKRLKKYKTRIIYTAHGFHFHKSAPIKNWIIYYPIEKALSKVTDTLITINQEDYNRAKEKFKSKNIKYIPGVGIDINRINKINVNKLEYRKKIDMPEDAFIILSVGELNENKNHETVIEALSMVNEEHIYYVICGLGPLEKKLKKKALDHGLHDKVVFLGYRKDVIEICKISDAFVFPSKREGLGLAALEAMASGLPLITSNVHGIIDYSESNKTGFTSSPSDVNGFKESIEKIYYNKTLQYKFKENNLQKAKKFDIEIVNREMKKIYTNKV